MVQFPLRVGRAQRQEMSKPDGNGGGPRHIARGRPGRSTGHGGGGGGGDGGAAPALKSRRRLPRLRRSGILAVLACLFFLAAVTNFRWAGEMKQELEQHSRVSESSAAGAEGRAAVTTAESDNSTSFPGVASANEGGESTGDRGDPSARDGNGGGGELPGPGLGFSVLRDEVSLCLERRARLPAYPVERGVFL